MENVLLGVSKVLQHGLRDQKYRKQPRHRCRSGYRADAWNTPALLWLALRILGLACARAMHHLTRTGRLKTARSPRPARIPIG